MYNRVQFCIKSKHQAKTHMRSRLLGHACCFEGWLPAVLRTTKSANSEICPQQLYSRQNLQFWRRFFFYMLQSWQFPDFFGSTVIDASYIINKFLHWLKSVVSNSKYHIGSKGRVDVISYIIFSRCTYY